MAKMMIVGPDSREKQRLKQIVGSNGRALLSADNLRDAKALIRRGAIDCVFCFYEAVDGTVVDLIQWTRSEKLRVRIVVITDFSESRRAAEAMGKGAFDYIPTPLDPTEVTACIGRLLLVQATNEHAEQVRFEADQGVLIMHFPSEVSFDAATALARLIDGQLATPEKGLIFNLEKTQYFSSSGISLLFLLYEAFQDLGERILITDARPHIRHTMKLAGVEQFFQFVDSVEVGLKRLQA